MICYCDGGYRNDGLNGSNNSGYGSYSITLADQSNYVVRFDLPEATSNNDAEYMSLIKLLEWLKENSIKEDIQIYSDSQLLVNQVNNKWKINYQRLHDLKNIVDSFKIDFDLNWIPRNLIVAQLGH